MKGAFLPLVLLLGVVTSASAQQITIKVVSSKNGRPFPRQLVGITVRSSNKTVKQIDVTTTDNGTASLVLPESPQLEIYVGFFGKLLECWNRVEPIDVSAVLRTGLLAHCDRVAQKEGCLCAPSARVKALKPVPGELILPARTEPFLWKIRPHIWE